MDIQRIKFLVSYLWVIDYNIIDVIHKTISDLSLNTREKDDPGVYFIVFNTGTYNSLDLNLITNSQVLGTDNVSPDLVQGDIKDFLNFLAESLLKAFKRSYLLQAINKKIELGNNKPNDLENRIGLKINKIYITPSEIEVHLNDIITKQWQQTSPITGYGQISDLLKYSYRDANHQIISNITNNVNSYISTPNNVDSKIIYPLKIDVLKEFKKELQQTSNYPGRLSLVDSAYSVLEDEGNKNADRYREMFNSNVSYFKDDNLLNNDPTTNLIQTVIDETHKNVKGLIIKYKRF